MKETISNLKKVFNYGKEHKKYLINCMLVSLLIIVINIALPILSAKQIVYLTTDLYEELLLTAVAVLIIRIVQACNYWLLRRNSQKFFRGTGKNIQISASNEILKIKLSDIDKVSSGVFIKRIGGDTEELSRIYTRGIHYLQSIFTDIGIFVAIFIINKIVFACYLVGTILLTCLHLRRVKKVNEKDKIHRKQSEKSNGLISELVRGVRDIKMLNAKESFMNEVEDNIDKLTNTQFGVRNTDMNYNFLINTTTHVIETSLIFLMVYMITNSIITVSSAIILYNYKERVLGNFIYNIGDLLSEIKSFNLSAERVFALMGNKEFKKETFGKDHIDKIKGDLEFKNVSFGYDESNQILKKMSFKVNANETIGFVGKSGVGKTTIFSLLCKLYDINDGQILLDGKNLKDLDEYSIRNNITIIGQSPYIFNLSIRDNLKLVKENLTEEEMINACKLACLDDFINTLPDKYDSIVGEGGVTLSGGQRQRLAIARAFIQDTKIILFDEATSALDNETQKEIQEAINNLKEKYTILIIAHRLSTIINCDKIMLIDDGKVKISGTHKELLKNSPEYKKLYENETLEED